MMQLPFGEFQISDVKLLETRNQLVGSKDGHPTAVSSRLFERYV
jgi:hypothetical protein